MNPHLHSVIVSYLRPELTQRTIDSYYATATLPFSLVVVDNGSDAETIRTLLESQAQHNFDLVLLGKNRFPGYATNIGWERMPDQTTHLHRQDNDFVFLPGWCEHLLTRFGRQTGQVGLRTDEEEQHASSNVGGCNVIRRALWDLGLRYDERPWGEQYPPGWTEDSLFSPAVKELGYKWTRVKQPCIVPISSEDPTDDYYIESWRLRGITSDA